MGAKLLHETAEPAAAADDLITPWLEHIQAAPAPLALEGLQTGRLVGWGEDGNPLVELPGPFAGPWPARTTVALTPGDTGREWPCCAKGAGPSGR
jgi:Domain of unknown function (DUF6484)